MLAMPVSPSPASTSSQEDACKPPPRNCYRLVMLGSARVGKTAIVARTVTVEEAEQYCVSQDECCIFVEVSAKRNYHVDELFYQLFVVAGLPLEMAPNHHRKVPLTFGSPTMLPPSQPRHKATLSIKRRLSDACGVVAPNVRRPSIRTDLMIMRTKTCSLAAGNENNTPGSRITLRTGRTQSRKACSIQ
ncbi:PREDICTED: dexamethasone-induced Ras-related protein 1 [Atta cephalotes]|uniref:Uncharacterized protein n=1 Tax=Atta cephalotes TaxID=12957 RepID=A0A158NIA7_ATTCE|nr:PREDICTED: dexamethasone-induced Ras-related protein 1 [Atta cephalotes]